MKPRKRPATSPPSDHAAWTRDALPALTGFLRGYLHEDFLEEHGSAEAAARAFRDAASPAELEALEADLDTLAQAVSDLPIARIRRLLVDELGSAWIPGSRAELERLIAALRQGPPSS